MTLNSLTPVVKRTKYILTNCSLQHESCVGSLRFCLWPGLRW